MALYILQFRNISKDFTTFIGNIMMMMDIARENTRVFLFVSRE